MTKWSMLTGERIRHFSCFVIVAWLTYDLCAALLSPADPRRFLTRSECLLGSPEMIAALKHSDQITAFAYWLIPLYQLGRLVTQRHVPGAISLWVVAWTAAFIALCGLNHYFDSLTFSYPVYGTFLWVKWAMATVSVYAALCVFPTIGAAVVLPRDLVQETREALLHVLRMPVGQVNADKLRALADQLDLLR